MEFACNKLQELIHSLNKDSKLEKWSSNVNEDGTLIKIKYQHRIPAETSTDTREKNVPENRSTEHKSSVTETECQLAQPANRGTSCTAQQPPEQNGATATRTVFKPISNYHLKRDKKRLDEFKSRKNSVPDKHMKLRSESKNDEIEITRGNHSGSDLLPNLSPEKPVDETSFTSPWADKNPFSLLQVDHEEYQTPSMNNSSEISSGPDEDLYSEEKSEQNVPPLPDPTPSAFSVSDPQPPAQPSTLTTSSPVPSSSDPFTTGFKSALDDPSVRLALTEAFASAYTSPFRKNDESIT